MEKKIKFNFKHLSVILKKFKVVPQFFSFFKSTAKRFRDNLIIFQVPQPTAWALQHGNKVAIFMPSFSLLRDELWRNDLRYRLNLRTKFENRFFLPLSCIIDGYLMSWSNNFAIFIAFCFCFRSWWFYDFHIGWCGVAWNLSINSSLINWNATDFFVAMCLKVKILLITANKLFNSRFLGWDV